MNIFDLAAKITLDTKDYEEGLKDASKKTGGLASKMKSGLKTAVVTGGATVAAGASAVAGGIVALTKKAVDSYADYEQLIGGVETLFGAGGQSLEEYAKSVGMSVDKAKGKYGELIDSQNAIFKNSKNAFKDAGMSANEYMETVTGFSASLVQSLGGDTKKAADYAQTAVIDMSDNANKMGTDMEMIQNAYQGFAKDNFTMLDNLKLGYGGTGEEMKRLIKDAAELDSSIDANDTSFGNIVKSIHAVQTQMGVTGTTAKEAEGTISGSVAMTKAAWTNLVTGVADENANYGQLITDFVDSASAAANNLLPRIEQALVGAGMLIDKIVPVIVEKVPQWIVKYLPMILESGVSMILQLAAGLIKAVPDLVEKIPDIVKAVVKAFSDNKDMFKQIGKDLLKWVGDGIGNIGQWIKDKFKRGASDADRSMGKSKGKGRGRVNGSHANGLAYVPFDNYIAELHKGERVLTAEENRGYGKGSTNIFNIHTEARTAADLMQDLTYNKERRAWLGV